MNDPDPIEGWLAGLAQRSVDDSTVADGLAERSRLWADLAPHLPADATGAWLLYRDPAGVVAAKIATVTVVGRGDEADLRPDCRWLSRRHFRLQPDATGCRLEDLGGTNPVVLNGAPTIAQTLVSGDVIAVGDGRFLYLFMPLPV